MMNKPKYFKYRISFTVDKKRKRFIYACSSRMDRILAAICVFSKGLKINRNFVKNLGRHEDQLERDDTTKFDGKRIHEMEWEELGEISESYYKQYHAHR